MKYLKISIMIIFTIFFLLSCDIKDKDVTEITFWHVMGGPAGDALKEIVDSFNMKNPEYRIVPISVGTYEALSTKLMASMSNPPVISQVYESWTSEFYNSGVIEPIEELIDEDFKKDIENDFFEIFVKDNTFNGKLLSLPFNKSVPAYFYNKDMFKKFSIEKFPDNWEEFISVTKKLTVDLDKDGKIDLHGTAFNINVWMFECRLFQYNGALVDSNMNPLFNTPAGVKAIEIDKRIINVDKSGYITTGYQHQDDFLAKKVAIIYGSTVSLSFIKEAKPEFEFGVAPVPAGDKKAVVISGTNVAVFKKSSKKQKEGAVKFIKYFTSPEIQSYWSYRTGYLPVRKSSMDSELLKKRFEEYPGLKDVYLQLENSYMEPQDRIWYLGRKYLGNALEYAIKGNQDSKKVLDEAAQEILKEIKKK
ncbi:MAG: ABC transporter substrate-binding protein [candidate division WOR-3 bacterium]